MTLRFAVVGVVALLGATAAPAADSAVEAPIRTMVTAFNSGDVALAKSTHVAAPMIIDEPTAPFAWSGPNAFDEWLSALAASEKQAGKSGGKVALGAALRTSVMGDRAYVVVPSTYTFQQANRTMRETGTMTFALVRQAADWKIQGWTWSSPEAVPVAN